MKHLENYGVQALSTEELKSTDGGRYFLGGTGRMIRKALEYIGVIDALDDIGSGFNEGNSGSCPC